MLSVAVKPRRGFVDWSDRGVAETVSALLREIA